MTKPKISTTPATRPEAAATYTTQWVGTMTATSSIAHAGDTRGTITLLRREQILLEGQLVDIPVISGNSWRGQLRRIGEELLRETLHYQGQIPLAAAHVLRAGGALSRSAREPLSGSRLARVRELVPPLAIFGAAAGGRTYAGALMVGKLIPHLAETAHLTGHPGPPMLHALQLESYSRIDEAATTEFSQLTDPDNQAPTIDTGDGGAMLYRVETFPAGTTFSTWLHLSRVTATQHAFFLDVLDRFTSTGRLGGRRAAGHGTFTANLTTTHTPATPPPGTDWRTPLLEQRDEALAALTALA